MTTVNRKQSSLPDFLQTGFYYMPKLDQMNRLSVIDSGPKGVFLDGREFGPLYLREAPSHLRRGDEVNVFVYSDAANKIIATATQPRAKVGECAYLTVVAINEHGAFLDWGLPKDLLLPYSEQAYPVREGSSYVVYVTLDSHQRAIATTLLHHHLDEDHGRLRVGDSVDLFVAAKSKLGFKAVINQSQLGLIYHYDLSQPLRFGMKIKGWVKAIREDGKIDLSINTLDPKARDQLEMRILHELHQAGGRLELSDKSAPDSIFRIFKVSKKNFKRALGHLYKQRLIIIEPGYIELVKK